ncbi:hypothetical protein WPS_16470 [Vulcanimicrobium alpinum]|uniref:Uncharacterized protein n=1 Tax=Vulcanimicrobium alpinum TaxID=3016050 RepID=A0AAN2C9T5_UNVUL|nr:hypothetical protein [Vulcanimicrobium alpinum]BDE06371.1 hypothetical protein WPS_16470 [Vulcanimicrobium alpinum]
MIAADVAFRQAANAAAAAYAQAPPYLAYKTDVVVDVPSLRQHRSISRAVETRTKDDYAVLQDLPRGQRQYAHSFPVIPTFDALSYFHISYNGSRRDALSYVQVDRPLTFTTTASSESKPDVVVTYLRYYHAEYAADSNDRIAHIVMDPLPTLTTGNTSDFYIHDVYVDTASNLPTRVTYTGPTTTMAVDYAVVENHWLVSHMTYSHTFFGPLRIGRVTANVEATNSGFAFPATPNDPKLAGG